MNSQTPSRQARRGFVTVYLALSSLLLIPMAGLAIDFSVLYCVKGRLQTAVDAAAIGSGSMLQRSTDLTDPTQVAKIQDAAQRFFNADFPANFWGSSQVYYSATPSENSTTRVRTIYVHAAETVPMLFLRVLGIRNSTVAAEAASSVRFVTMMIVVDRSGSVQAGHAINYVEYALNTFVANPATSVFANGRDVIGMGSFSGNWRLDFPPTANFQSAGSDIGDAIDGLDFEGSTNTAEGLHQAYTKLQSLNNTGALNVILLLTDGRPSAFTGSFPAGGACTDLTAKNGFIAANVGSNASQWPPPTSLGVNGIQTFGVYSAVFSGVGNESTPVSNNSGCAFRSNGNNMYQDISNLPAQDAYGNLTTGPIYQGLDMHTNNPRSLRYAAFNAADNMATAIRQDTTIRPILFVIGLNEDTGEPLDADWLARVANDPSYTDQYGHSVYQAGQTPGMFINTNTAGLAAAFQTISSQILRISQ